MGFSPSISGAFFVSLLFSFCHDTQGADPNFVLLTLGKQTASTECAPSRTHDRGSLKIMHRNSPCSPLNTTETSLADTLAQDIRRVSSLQARISGINHNKTIISQSGVTIPAKNGAYLGYGNYVATLGLGTPTRDQTVVIDTGSDVCWVQCQPCSFCYSQEEPIFDPTLSTSYSRFTCESDVCLSLNRRRCFSGSCVYGVEYFDGSSTTGFLSSEMITLTSSVAFTGFVFGCGVDNRGLFTGVAGLIGLGRGPFSLASQASSVLGSVFSYCFPSKLSDIGWLSFGPPTAYRVDYTPMLTFSQAPSFYGIDLIGLTVGATRLPVSPEVFRYGGTIIDSGTIITRLPPEAYAFLRQAFRDELASYPLFQYSILDTCFDFTGAGQVSIPLVKLHYTNLDVTLDISGILLYVGINHYCLAFAGNPSPTYAGVIGNVQQKTFEVIYDIKESRIGFAANACA